VSRRLFVFDWCIAESAMHRIAELTRTRDEFRHLALYAKSRTPDSEWVERITNRKAVVITEDAGKHSKPGEALPVLLWEKKLSYIVLGSSIQELPMDEKIRVMVDAWALIVERTDSEPSIGFKLFFNDHRTGTRLKPIKVNRPARNPH
jgi:hypothetical protein